MASQSLYRKWRSQTFAELVGQEHVVQTLRNAVVEDRVAHAYLFTGPRGVGKTSMARLLAKAVNCTAGVAERPCGQCESCRAISDNRAVDIIEMDAASHTSVEDAREIIERVQFRPTQGRYKVYVIDEVHMLSTAAFNALLKTLEEPPAHALFILATTEIHKVPTTILSRCQRFTFTRHTISQISAHLEAIAQAEQLQLEPGVAQAVARAATGSMRDALSVLEQLSSCTNGTIRLEHVQSLLGTTTAVEVDSLMSALLNNDSQIALRVVNAVADQGADMRQFARDLVERLRALMLFVTTRDPGLLDLGEDDIATLDTWAQQTNPALLVQWIRLLSNLDYQLRVSAYGHLPLELALVEALVTQAPTPAAAPPRPAAPAQPTAPPKSRKAAPPPAPARPAASEKAQPATPAPHTNGAHSEPVPRPPQEQPPAAEQAAEPAEPAHPAEPAQSPDTAPPEPVAAHPAAHSDTEEAMQTVNQELSMLDQVEAVWAAVVRDVRPHDNKLQAMLRDVFPVDVEGNTVVLLAKYPFHRSQIEKPLSRQIIEQVLSTHLNTTVAIRCIMEEQEKLDDTRSQIHKVRNDPHVKAARNIFGAEVIAIEPSNTEQ